MTLLAVPFARHTGRSGALYGIGIGIVLAIVYWMALSVFGALGAGGWISPMLAAWAPNILFGGGRSLPDADRQDLIGRFGLAYFARRGSLDPDAARRAWLGVGRVDHEQDVADRCQWRRERALSVPPASGRRRRSCAPARSRRRRPSAAQRSAAPPLASRS